MSDKEASVIKVDEYIIRVDRLYTKDHEWVLIEKDKGTRVGITDYAQKSLHEIVYVEMPKVGSTVKQMETLGTVESIKAVSEVFAPLSGKIIEVNEKLVSTPELINESPYDEGWIAVIEPSALDEEIKNLLTHKEYGKLISDIIRKERE